MIWLAWRQFRFSAYVILGVLVVFAIAFGLTGPHLAHVYDTTVKTCGAHDDCSSVLQNFTNRYVTLQNLIQLMEIFPVVLGAFWGAPLIAREFETGTFRLAWTQGVSRTRWIVVKLTMVGLASAVAAGLFSLMVTWWSSPLDRVRDTPFGSFDARDLVPVGYALFAFALGAAAGAIFRRTMPAIATTIVGFIAVRLAVTDWIRPYFKAPLVTTTKYQPPFSSVGSGPHQMNVGDWIISEQTATPSGQVIGRFGGFGPNGVFGFSGSNPKDIVFTGVGRCPNVFPKDFLTGGGLNAGSSASGVHVSGPPSGSIMRAMDTCINSFHLTSIVHYQPTSRYWLFQWDELGLFVLMACALSAVAIWWTRRR